MTKRQFASFLLLVTLAACVRAPTMSRHNCSSGGEVCIELQAEEPIRWGEPIIIVTTVTSEKNISDLRVYLTATTASDAVVLKASGEEPGKVIEEKQSWVNWQVDMKEKQPVVFTRKIILPPREGEFRIQAQASQPGYFAQDMIRIYLTKKGGDVYHSGTPIPITPKPLPLGPTLSPEEVETLRAAPTDTPYVPTVTPSPEITGAWAYPPPGATQVYTPLPTYSPAPTQTPTPTPVVIDNGWYLYIDKEAGYSFSYPPDVSLSSGQSAALDYKAVTLSFQIPDTSGYQGMQIIVYSNKERLPIERFVVEKVFQGKSKAVTEDTVLSAMTPIKVAGYDAIKINIQPFEPAVLVSVEDKVFFAAPSPDMRAGNPPDPESVELFYKILDTFTPIDK